MRARSLARNFFPGEARELLGLPNRPAAAALIRKGNVLRLRLTALALHQSFSHYFERNHFVTKQEY